MSAQAELFPNISAERRDTRAERVLCRQIDATTLLDGTKAVHLVCPNCGYNRGWWKPEVLKKGVECPMCTPPPLDIGAGCRGS